MPILVLAGLLIAALPACSEAAEISAFTAWTAPRETWERGYGAAFTVRFFGVVAFEGEGLRVPVQGPTPSSPSPGSLVAFTASALVSPPVGVLVVPYGGFGVGLYRQTLGGKSDTGRLAALIVGVKAGFGSAFAKAEYRDYSLSTEPLLALDKRYSLGVGISF